DMMNQGRWQDVVVIIFTEFGRRNFANANPAGPGTDHGHGNVVFMFGGCVNGGQHYASPLGLTTDADFLLDWMPGDLDFRQIFNDVCKLHLGIPQATLTPVFSEPTTPTNASYAFTVDPNLPIPFYTPC
ncbi:MAG: DUF1501 domain-containing protein, partial [Phycisphaerales bacterium]|nr:DUF1501 domain-containing protein [Phycisphaerales bacterium]